MVEWLERLDYGAESHAFESVLGHPATGILFLSSQQ